MNYLFIAGSNLGERASFLRSALREMERVGDVLRVGSLHVTRPVGYYSNWFYNLGFVGELGGSPFWTLKYCKFVEKKWGRRGVGDRTLDIDVVSAPVRIKTAALTLPHPRHPRRSFSVGIAEELGVRLFGVRRGGSGRWRWRTR